MKRTLNAALIFVAILSTSLLAFQLFTASTFEGIENEKYHENFENSYNIFALNLPAKMDFAGEEVPLNLIDVREKMDRELLVNTYWQSQTLLLLKRSHRWFPADRKDPGRRRHSRRLQVPRTHGKRFVHKSYHPAGATGFWQLMKDAARERGLEVNNDVDERYHIEKSTHAACAYLRDAKEKFGSWTIGSGIVQYGYDRH